MCQYLGKQDLVAMKSTKFFGLAINTLYTPERMLQDFDFPIAFCYGSRDFFGSDGADRIVRNSRYFETGRSQIFKVKNAGHNIFLDNLPQLTDYMIGFFNGTITGKFDLKPVREWTADNWDE